MKVHVICRDPSEDRVLARFSQYLSRHNGWSVGPQPDAHAHLNYFAVYVDQAERLSGWQVTPLGAYFSHYEVDHAYKKLWWWQARQAVGLRVITSDLAREHLDDSHPIVKVPPAIDEQFLQVALRQKPLGKKLRIGFSGIVSPHSDRKGPSLARGLLQEYGKEYEFVATGINWPVPTGYLAFRDLPQWFQSLDLFVCTSSIEGIPMPPLEALACGIPVIIPRGVGMLDELPDATGAIIRYSVDNFVSLQEALQEAVHFVASSPVPSQTCRELVAGYTSSAYATALSDAVECYLDQGIMARAAIPVVKLPESDRHGQRGCLYVAYGDNARACATAGIQSFKKYMPGVPVALVSDRALGPEDIFIAHDDEDIGGRSAKTLIDSLAPREWQYVMYLDADTEVIAPIDFLFQVVEDGFDLAICKNPGKYHTVKQMVRSDNKDECEYTFNLIGSTDLIQLNGGVFVYQRNVRTKAFFATWHSEWQRWGKRDQAALLRALFAHPLKCYVLGNEWNTITRYDSADNSAGILHFPMTARRWRGMLHERSDSPEAWQAVRRFESMQPSK